MKTGQSLFTVKEIKNWLSTVVASGIIIQLCTPENIVKAQPIKEVSKKEE